MENSLRKLSISLRKFSFYLKNVDRSCLLLCNPQWSLHRGPWYFKINTKVCLSDHLSSKTGLLLRFHCRTFLTEITESKAAEDDVFLTPVSDVSFKEKQGHPVSYQHPSFNSTVSIIQRHSTDTSVGFCGINPKNFVVYINQNLVLNLLLYIEFLDFEIELLSRFVLCFHIIPVSFGKQ